MNMLKTPTASLQSDLAARDLIDLLENNRQGHFMHWLYQNGGSKIFSALSAKNPYYVLRQHEIQNIDDNAVVLGNKAKDTQTAVIVGGADAVSDKELKILSEMVRQNPRCLRHIELIDLSAEFNSVAEAKVKAWIQTLPNELQAMTVSCTNKAIQDLTAADLKKIHNGNVTVFTMGGTALNPEGTISGGLPDGRIKEFLGHIAKIAGNPDSDKNKVVMGYSKKANSLAYTYIPSDEPNASSQFWFMNGLLYNINQIEGIAEANRSGDFPSGFGISDIMSKFTGYYHLDKASRTSKNGLQVTDSFRIVIPYQGAQVISEVREGTSLVFANSVHPSIEDMNRLARTLSPSSLQTNLICSHPNPDSGSVVELFDVHTPKLSLAA